MASCYNAVMSGWRKFGVVVAAMLLPLVLLAWGLVFTSYSMLATPDRLKQVLETSGVYETFISDILNQTHNNEGGQPAKEDGVAIPTNHPEVKKAIHDAASPEFLKAQVEGFLDSIYAWLRGETAHLAFQIDLTEVKAKLGEGLVSAARDRLASLPACSGPINPSAEFDAFTAECLPRGIDANAAAEQFRSEIDKLIENPVITQDDIKNKEGKPLEQQLQAFPGLYSRMVSWMWLGAVLALLLAVAVVLLSVPWRAGLKRAGIIFVSVGGISIVLAALGAFLIKRVAETVGGEGGIQSSALNVISQLVDGFRFWWVWFGVVVLALGIAALITSLILRHKETPLRASAAMPEPETAAPADKSQEKPEKKS